MEIEFEIPTIPTLYTLNSRQLCNYAVTASYDYDNNAQLALQRWKVKYPDEHNFKESAEYIAKKKQRDNLLVDKNSTFYSDTNYKVGKYAFTKQGSLASIWQRYTESCYDAINYTPQDIHSRANKTGKYTEIRQELNDVSSTIYMSSDNVICYKTDDKRAFCAYREPERNQCLQSNQEIDMLKTIQALYAETSDQEEYFTKTMYTKDDTILSAYQSKKDFITILTLYSGKSDSQVVRIIDEYPKADIKAQSYAYRFQRQQLVSSRAFVKYKGYNKSEELEQCPNNPIEEYLEKGITKLFTLEDTNLFQQRRKQILESPEPQIIELPVYPYLDKFLRSGFIEENVQSIIQEYENGKIINNWSKE